jgi:hypothetical protein
MKDHDTCPRRALTNAKQNLVKLGNRFTSYILRKIAAGRHDLRAVSLGSPWPFSIDYYSFVTLFCIGCGPYSADSRNPQGWGRILSVNGLQQPRGWFFLVLDGSPSQGWTHPLQPRLAFNIPARHPTKGWVGLKAEYGEPAY